MRCHKEIEQTQLCFLQTRHRRSHTHHSPGLDPGLCRNILRVKFLSEAHFILIRRCKLSWSEDSSILLFSQMQVLVKYIELNIFCSNVSISRLLKSFLLSSHKLRYCRIHRGPLTHCLSASQTPDVQGALEIVWPIVKDAAQGVKSWSFCRVQLLSTDLDKNVLLQLGPLGTLDYLSHSSQP
jgi:hypothetical protein